MVDEDWEEIVPFLRWGWPGDFPPEAAGVYRVLLDRFPPGEVLGALMKRAEEGQKFRPSAAELCHELSSKRWHAGIPPSLHRKLLGH